MPAAKKTMSVAKMLHMANSYLAAENTTKEGRRAIASMIEGVLQETGNYRGFSVKENPEISPYADDAPVRHFYFVSGKLDEEYYQIDKSAA
jgi:hypothetical protein